MKKGFTKIVLATIFFVLAIFILYNIVSRDEKNKEWTEGLAAIGQNEEVEFVQESAMFYGVKMILKNDLRKEATAEADSEKISIEPSEKEPEVEPIQTAYGAIFEKEGYFENFPCPEINKTEWEGDRLLSVEVRIEYENRIKEKEDDDIYVHFETPVLIGKTPAVDKINRDLEKQYEIALEECNEWIDWVEDGIWGGVYAWDCFLSYNHDGVINFGICLQYGAGGPMERGVHSYTYDLNTGERLNIAGVLDVGEENLQDALLEGFRNSAKKDPENILWESYRPEELIERLKDYTAEDFNYCINKDGAVDIWFEKYELMSGANGMQAATIGSIHYESP